MKQNNDKAQHPRTERSRENEQKPASLTEKKKSDYQTSKEPTKKENS